MAKIEFYSLDADRAVFSAEGCADRLCLSPMDMYDAMKLFQRILFAWHELTGKKLDEGFNPEGG